MGDRNAFSDLISRYYDRIYRLAWRERRGWTSADYGFGGIDAFMLRGQGGRGPLGNMVDPKYTMGASILKNYLKP